MTILGVLFALLTSSLAVAIPVGDFAVEDPFETSWMANQAKIGDPKTNSYVKQEFANGDMYYDETTEVGFVQGRIRSTLNSKGVSTLGLPIGFEKKYSTFGVSQKTAKGRIYYSASDGSRTSLDTKTISMIGVSNFRDAAGNGRGIQIDGGYMKREQLYRSGKLIGMTGGDKTIALTLKWVTIIDFRSSSKASAYPDPSIPGVDRFHYPIPGDSDYPKYVTSSARREAFRKALVKVAEADGAVDFHCTAGRDRTGWAVAIIHYLLGASDATVMTEYMKSPGASAAKMRAGVSQVMTSYGSMDNYIRNGIGLTQDDIDALKSKFTA